MATELSNHYKAQLHSGLVNLTTDSIKIILMATAFTFNKDTHATYADVSASELATGNGYTQNTKTLTGVSVANIEDDTNDRSDVSWANAVWTAAGGSIGPSPGAILFDDTTADDTVMGYIDFGSDQTATDGGTFTITAPLMRLS